MKSPSIERIGDVNIELELLDPAKAEFFQEMGYTGVCKINGGDEPPPGYIKRK